MFSALLCFLLLLLPSARAQSDTTSQDIFSQASRLSASDLRQRLQQEGAAALVNASDVFYMTPLMFAASNNPDPEVVELLLELGATLEARASNGLTTLMFAARDNPNPEVARTLVQRGADIHLRDFRGQSAVDYALQNPALGSRSALLEPPVAALESPDSNMPTEAAVVLEEASAAEALAVNPELAEVPEMATLSEAELSSAATDDTETPSGMPAEVTSTVASTTATEAGMDTADAFDTFNNANSADTADISETEPETALASTDSSESSNEAVSIDASVASSMPAVSPSVAARVWPAASAAVPATSVAVRWGQTQAASEVVAATETAAEVSPEQASAASAEVTATFALAWGSCVDLNVASLEALQQLAGIGVAEAEAIVAARRLLRFRDVAALQLLEAIDSATLEAILEQGRACVH